MLHKVRLLYFLLILPLVVAPELLLEQVVPVVLVQARRHQVVLIRAVQAQLAKVITAVTIVQVHHIQVAVVVALVLLVVLDPEVNLVLVVLD
jgi:hypothetical protein